MLVKSLKQRSRQLKSWTLALYLACRDPRVPWPARLLALGVVVYALSPIDLIPDFIPVLGYLDDLILIPLGISLAIRLIPTDVLAECRERAAEMAERPTSWVGAGVVVAIWLIVAGLIVWAVLSRVGIE